MTPVELNKYIKAHAERQNEQHELSMYYSWLTAKLTRVVDFPSFDTLVKLKKEPQTDEDMLNEIMKLNAQFGGSTY